MKIKDAIEYGYFSLTSDSEGMLKTKMVLAYILDVSRDYLITHDDQELTESQEREFKSYIDELIEGYPVQYITHSQYFRGTKFYVDENVLIPQPDTEVLIDETIKIINKYEQKNPDEKLSILDMCTGSGAIVVSLAKEKPNNTYYASDISQEALKVANMNALENKVDISFMQGDLFDAIAKKEERDELDYENYMNFVKYGDGMTKPVSKPVPYTFDIIVANPPYIESGTIPKLSSEVKHEPSIALDGGMDGLDFYRRIASESTRFLNSIGYVIVEIGYNQKDYVESIFKTLRYQDVFTVQDLAGNDRVVVAKYMLER